MSASSVPEDVTRILGPNETVQLFIQQRIYHPKINIDSVVLTNERIILRHPHDLRLKEDYTDFNYKDISNVVLDKGLLRSTIRCTLRIGGDPLALGDLPNDEAEKAYGIIRENLTRYQTPFSAGQEGIPGFQSPMPAVLKCPKCGSIVPAGQKFCGNCGAVV